MRPLVLSVVAGYGVFAFNSLAYWCVAVGGNLVGHFLEDEQLGVLLVAWSLSSLVLAPLCCGWMLGRLWPRLSLAPDEFYRSTLLSALSLCGPLVLWPGHLTAWPFLICIFLVGCSFRVALVRRSKPSGF